MTFDERLAALGVETRDFVPSDEHCKNLYDKFYAEAKRICKLMGGKLDGPFMVSLLLVAVAKRDIIIDRMETRIVNLTGERDWLLEYYGANDGIDSCSLCIFFEEPNDSTICTKCNYSSQFERADVPEEWRVDDA